MPPLLIDIPQMIDLALGTPEIGVVNFTVLHSLLHAIAELLDLDKNRVEFRGSQGMKIENLLRNIPAEPILTVDEFKVDEIEEGDRQTLKRTAINKPRSSKIERIVVIRKTNETDEDGQPIVMSRDRKSIVQPVRIVSQDDFRKLDPKADSIHDPIGQIMPNNNDLFDSVRGSEDSRNAVGDMWHILNITKRVDATEVAIEKITSMVRDVAEEYRNTKNTVERIAAMSDVSGLTDKLDNLEKIVHDKFGGKGLNSDRSKPSSNQTRPAPSLGTNAVPAAPLYLDARKKGGLDKTVVEKELQSPATDQGDHNNYGAHDDQRRQNNSESFDNLIDDLRDLREEVGKIKEIVQQILSSSEAAAETFQKGAEFSAESPEFPSVVASSKAKPNAEIRSVARRMDLLESKFGAVEHQIYDMEKELAELSDRFEDDIRPKTGPKTDVTDIAEIYAQITSMKTDLELTIDRCNSLIVEREHMNENLEQITKKMEDVKTSKVDKDEIDELLTEKADYNMLQRKVSVDQFDATRRYLTNGLVEALEKLSEQSQHWEGAIDNVRLLVENKIDRAELTPFREYVDNKINAVQERLKALAALRRDPEAAGTRSKFLRQVNCISCDQDVVMRLDEPGIIPRPEALPAQSTLKPFLVYELDSIRKQMKDPNGRNLRHFEVLTKEKQVLMEGKPKRIANRYCGGSHTVLTAQDKTQRCKFNKKLYPAECFLKSDEGCYYRALKKECVCPSPNKIEVIEKPKESGLISARSSKSEVRSKKTDDVNEKLEEEAVTPKEPRASKLVSAEDKLSAATSKKVSTEDKLSETGTKKSLSTASKIASTEDKLVTNGSKRTLIEENAVPESEKSIVEETSVVAEKEGSIAEKLSTAGSKKIVVNESNNADEAEVPVTEKEQEIVEVKQISAEKLTTETENAEETEEEEMIVKEQDVPEL